MWLIATDDEALKLSEEPAVLGKIEFLRRLIPFTVIHESIALGTTEFEVKNKPDWFAC